jgi:glycerol uptake operon antiterminator
MYTYFGYPIVAALQSGDLIDAVARSRAQSVFVRCGDIRSIRSIVRELLRAGKRVYVQMELVKGLANDQEAVGYLSDEVRPHGIVTTKGFMIRAIRSAGLAAVHHVFLMDFHSLHQGIKNVKTTKPDAVEIMPGLMPRVVREFRDAVSVPLVVGGMIRYESEILAILEAGADAAICGTPELWDIGLSHPALPG